MLRSRVFLGGQAVSMLGDGLALLAVPLLVLQLTGSPVAAVLASLPASAGCLTLLTGAFAWFAGLQKAPMTEVASQLGGRSPS